MWLSKHLRSIILILTVHVERGKHVYMRIWRWIEGPFCVKVFFISYPTKVCANSVLRRMKHVRDHYTLRDHGFPWQQDVFRMRTTCRRGPLHSWWWRIPAVLYVTRAFNDLPVSHHGCCVTAADRLTLFNTTTLPEWAQVLRHSFTIWDTCQSISPTFLELHVEDRWCFHHALFFVHQILHLLPWTLLMDELINRKHWI